MDANRWAFAQAWPALEELEAAIDLTRAAVENMIVNREAMAQRCVENFSTVTQLADTLVTLGGLSFRDAHELVGALVREAIDAGIRADGITHDMLLTVAARHGCDEAASRVTARELATALDPLVNVQVRSHVGGPAPDTVSRAIEDGRTALDQDRQRLEAFRAALDGAHEALRAKVTESLRSGRPWVG